MVAALTTADLLSRVKAHAQLPTTEGRLTDAEILALADEVLRTTCSDLLVGARSQWWTTAAADVSIVSGTYLYAVPERALAEGVSDVLITDGTHEWSAPEVTLAEAWRYREGHGGWDSPHAYVWRDERLELLPHPTATAYSLRILYPRRPSRLVTVASCAVVSSSTSTSITITTASPSGWASSEALDVISATTGRQRGVDLAGTSIGATNITLSAGVPTGTAAGDYVALDGETCVPPLPEPVFDVLTAATTLEVLMAIGDSDGLQAAGLRLQQRISRAQSLLSPRSRGASRKIVAHGYGTRRGRR